VSTPPPRPAATAAWRADPGAVVVLAAGLVVVAGLAWAWTLAMAATPGCHCVALGDFVVMWTVMMAAMMLPAIVPVVLAFATFSRARRGGALVSALAFVAGYLVVWGALALPARGLIAAGESIASAVPWAAARAGGVALLACGLYQLTPLKDVCLRHCRSPHLFLGHHWRDGVGGALLLGAHHGLYCAGCCASLMLVLLVVGVMNVAWMVGLAALILVEKAVPGGVWIGRAAGAWLCAVGVVRLVT
jgi:predicted metal-binding membrane protein